MDRLAVAKMIADAVIGWKKNSVYQRTPVTMSRNSASGVHYVDTAIAANLSSGLV